MTELAIISQLIVAATVISVWTVRYNRSTRWRGGEAGSMAEEFYTYGLSTGILKLTRFTKLTLAALLVAGLWYPELAALAALGMAALMLIAVGMHVKVGDRAQKSVPAFAMLVLCLIVVYVYGVPAIGEEGLAAAGM